jgi:hypothetical protein
MRHVLTSVVELDRSRRRLTRRDLLQGILHGKVVPKKCTEAPPVEIRLISPAH